MIIEFNSGWIRDVNKVTVSLSIVANKAAIA